MGKEFVLVHGMSHGAWAWEGLVRRLEQAGHHEPMLSALDDLVRILEKIPTEATR